MPTPFNYQNANISNPYSGVAVTAPNTLKSATGQWWNTTVSDPDIFAQSGNALSTVLPPPPQTPTTPTTETGGGTTPGGVSSPTPMRPKTINELVTGGTRLPDGRVIGGYYPWELGQPVDFMTPGERPASATAEEIAAGRAAVEQLRAAIPSPEIVTPANQPPVSRGSWWENLLETNPQSYESTIQGLTRQTQNLPWANNPNVAGALNAWGGLDPEETSLNAYYQQHGFYPWETDATGTRYRSGQTTMP